MRKYLILFLLATLIVPTTVAQDKLFTMDEAVMGARTTLRPAGLQQFQWIPATSVFAYVKSEGETTNLYMGNAANANQSVLMSLADLNKVVSDQGLAELKSFPRLKWLNANEFEYTSERKIYRYNIDKKKIGERGDVQLDEKAAHIDEDPASGATAYCIDNNLFVLKNNKVQQVTDDNNIGIVNGQAVHRFEFGVFKGTFWSPTGKQLAFYRKDETMVTDYPVIDWATMPAANKNVKYPMAGGKSHHVTLGIYNVETAKTHFIKTGEPKEQYLTNITWSPDGNYIYIVVLNRDQNHFKMNRYNASTGDFDKTLFEEKHDKYIQPLHVMEFVKNKPNFFLWQSRRDDYNHLYLYNTDGKMVKQLTSGPWEVTGFVGFDDRGKTAYFMAAKESPLERDLYAVKLSSAKAKRLSSGNGTHGVRFNDSGEYFYDVFSNTKTPRMSGIYYYTGSKVLDLNTAANPLSDYKMSDMTIGTIKSEDGSDLYYRMYLPVDFDATEKYPVLVYVYGGPGVQLIKNRWLGGGNLWYHLMAQKGYVVFTVENRGTPFRGRKFEHVTFRELGTKEMNDQLKGVDFLKTLPYVDQERIGVHGWSYGGYMTTTLMTRSPGVFKVGVAGGPVIDWDFYEVMYTERFMDTPETNEEGYKVTNLRNYVKDLEGRLLIIHGTDDDVVVWQHSLSYIKQSVDDGVLVDYMVYPGHPHNVRGKDRVHLMNKITQYIEDHL